jgi:hypothetical protein
MREGDVPWTSSPTVRFQHTTHQSRSRGGGLFCFISVYKKTPAAPRVFSLSVNCQKSAMGTATSREYPMDLSNPFTRDILDDDPFPDSGGPIRQEWTEQMTNLVLGYMRPERSPMRCRSDGIVSVPHVRHAPRQDWDQPVAPRQQVRPADQKRMHTISSAHSLMVPLSLSLQAQSWYHKVSALRNANRANEVSSIHITWDVLADGHRDPCPHHGVRCLRRR